VPPPTAARLGRTQRWLIGGVVAAVLWLAAAALAVAGAAFVIGRATRPGAMSDAAIPRDLWQGQVLFFAAGGLFQLGIGAVVIATILGLKVPPP
jgi:hypothetical protein